MLRYRVRRRRIRLAAVWLAVAAAGPLLTVAGPLLAAAAQGAGRPVVVAAEIDALIHPVSAEFIAQTISRADDEDAELVVLVLRTPGGLVDSTRDINTSIIESETPVVVYVGPSGTRAASAGFLITIAADIAAMAPGTHIGAAHPVSGSGQAMDETAAEKAASDVAAYARSLASQRERNVELAEKAVTDSQSFTEREALEAEPPLIDLVAADLDALIEQLDGREVRRWDGDTVTLRTAGARIEQVEMNWRQRLLSAVAHPQVAVLLFSLGTLGLTIELWNPGAILPGIVGGLCLLLAFFAFQILPINYVGLLLILFGLALLVAEMLTATYGLLATGGLGGDGARRADGRRFARSGAAARLAVHPALDAGARADRHVADAARRAVAAHQAGDRPQRHARAAGANHGADPRGRGGHRADARRALVGHVGRGRSAPTSRYGSWRSRECGSS